MADRSLCRFCHESTPPLISPCSCDGSLKYIHQSCIFRWATIGGSLDYSKLTCSLCNTAYRIPEIRLERLSTGIYIVDVLLYNSAGFTIALNYLSILYGIHTGEGIEDRLRIAQVYIHLVYSLLYAMYLRIENVDLYASVAIQGWLYPYVCIQVFSSYMGLYEQHALMSITGIIAHTVLWRTHVRNLRLVNESLLKNG